MRVLALLLSGCLCASSSAAQQPLSDEPGVILYLVSSNSALPSVSRVLEPAQIACTLPSEAPPAGASPSAFYVTWADPLGTGATFCQVDITPDVQGLPAGDWYASLTFLLPATTWGTGPCPTGGCPPLRVDGRAYPVFYIAGHETPAFTVGKVLHPPTNLTIKAEP